MKALHEEAKQQIFTSRLDVFCYFYQFCRNSRFLDHTETGEQIVDLHGLHPNEAVDILKSHVFAHATTNRTIYIIVGTGHHAFDKQPKLLIAVTQFLDSVCFIIVIILTSVKARD